MANPNDGNGKTQSGRVALCVVSDEHINSTVALCPPTVNLDDGGTYHASRTQIWLWRSWQSFWQQVKEDTAGYRRILVNNGDLGELDTAKRSIQLVTLNKSTIQNMVIDTLEPALSICDSSITIRGTAAHTGKSSWLEEAIAQDIDITIPSVVTKGEDGKAQKIASWWQYRGVAEGVKVDFAHHASFGGNKWLKGTGAIRLAARTTWQYRVQRRAEPPDIITRSHNHQYADSGGNFDTLAVFTPAWTALTEYGYRMGYENEVSDIGGLVYLCEGGKVEVKKYQFYPAQERQIWKMTL